jgi:hypothetical protein
MVGKSSLSSKPYFVHFEKERGGAPLPDVESISATYLIERCETVSPHAVKIRQLPILRLGQILPILHSLPVSQTPSDWDNSKDIAKSKLRDRVSRRKMLAYWLLFVLAWIVLGLWVIDGWLAEFPTRFVAWWCACLLITLILIIFALYDALSVVREEKHNKNQ